MFRKALITMAVLGATSTAALARPIISADVDVEASWSTTPSPVVIRDHRYDSYQTYDTRPRVDLHRIRFARRPRVIEPSLYMLSEVNNFSGRTGEVWLRGTQARTLAIQANGPMYVESIGVEYFSGGQVQHQLIQVNRTLDRFSPMFAFDLGGRVQLNRIQVYSRNGAPMSAFSVLGR